jgi:hypothetical protein
MYKLLVFIDFENLQKIDSGLIGPETKLIIMVGLEQDDKAFNFAKDLFKDIPSIELVKVNGRGHNALDIFIAFYIGLYFENIKQSEIVICSNDLDYDQLIKHLNGHGVSIKRMGYQAITNREPNVKNKKEKTIKKKEKPRQSVGMVKADDIQKVIDYLRKQTISQKKKFPKKISTLENYLHTHFTNKISEGTIREAIETMKKEKLIIVIGKKVKYNSI